MFKKLLAAVAVFCATLLVSTGCPRQEAGSPTTKPPRDDQAASGTTTTSTPTNSVATTTNIASATTSTGDAIAVKGSDKPDRVEPPTPKPADEVPAVSQPLPSTAATTRKPAAVEAPASDVTKPAEPGSDQTVAAAEKKPPSAAGDNGGDPGAQIAKKDDPLFQGWPKPLAVIVATGMQMGYIEPCGCSGKKNQLGGLSRRHSFLKKLAADGWTVVPLDVGGQVRRFGTQSEYKFQRTADALKAMHYGAIALGTDDLRLPANALAGPIADNTEAFVSANAAVFGFEQNFTPRFQIITAGKVKLGVTAVLGASAQRAINNDDIKFKPADEALKEVLPKLKEANCDHLILLAHATQRESIELAKKFPEFDFVITSGGAPEPPREPAVVEGTKTRLVEVGQKGEYANVIGLFDEPPKLRFRMVPLVLKLGESEEMRQLMAAYQDQLQQQGLAGLGIKPVAHPTGRQFVGAKVCGECHTKAYSVWEATPHAKALDTLKEQKPPRQYDPECLSCHVTGWEPQKFYPFQGGYMSLDKTPQLAHNGCENCHGPGSAHAAAELKLKKTGKAADREVADLRAAMRAVASADTCIQCHDADNSLKFDFKSYWPQVEHKGKD